MATLFSAHEVARELQPLQALGADGCHYLVDGGAKKAVIRGGAVEEPLLLGLRQSGAYQS